MNVKNYTESQLRMLRARIDLLRREPFFGNVVLQLGLIEDPQAIIVQNGKAYPSIMTNGKHIRYHPEFPMAHSKEELGMIMAHEVLHVVSLHPMRRGHRDPELWNIACDFVVNDILKEGGWPLSEGCLYAEKYKGLSAESIYEQLREMFPPPPQGGQGDNDQDGKGKPKQGKGNGQSKGKGGGQGNRPRPQTWGGVEDPTNDDGTPMNQEQKDQLEREATQKADSAAAAAKSVGKLPANLERYVQEMRKPKVDWKKELKDFVTNTQPKDYSWSRPNRRFIGQGVYLPGMIKEGIAPIAVIIDTSGSIGQIEFDAFAAEINSIVDMARPERIHLIFCDAAVNKTEQYEMGETVESETMSGIGGGGTDFRPPFKWVKAHAPEVKAVIYLTDLYGPFPEREFHCPTMWLCTTDQVAPWGKTVKLDLEQ